MDEIYRVDAERVKEIVLEFIELDDENLLLKDVLRDGVQEIDFTQPDAFETLAKLITTYSTSSGSGLQTVEIHHIDFINGNVSEYDERTIKTHDDIELFLEQPWKSSALRKLWKAITCYEFGEMWDEGDGLPRIVEVLEILLLVTDEEAYVPFVQVDKETSGY